MKSVRLTGVTASDGSLTVLAPSPVRGFLWAVDVNLSACDATADAALSTSGADAALALLTLTDSQLNTTLYPRGTSCGLTGTLNTGSYDVLLPLLGTPKLVIAQAGSTKAVQVTLYYLED